MGKAIAGGIAILVILFGIGWAIQGNDFFLYKTFAPKYEEVRRETFEESQAHIEGKINTLTRLRLEFQTGEVSHRCALRAVVIQEAATAKHLPESLQTWVDSLTSGALKCE